MPSLLEAVSEQIGSDQINAIANRLGASPEQTEQAIQMALPTLLAALAKNAENEDGAAQLHAAVSRDHDGSILERLGGMFEGSANQSSSAGSLLARILGSRQSRVEQGIGKAAGLDVMKAGSLLAMLAPIVMGIIGRQTRGGKMDSGALAGMLRKERQTMEKQATGGLLGGLLDQDGDGDFDFQDILKMGFKKLMGR